MLPHTAGCVVCGPDNPQGLKLNFEVDLDLPPASATIRTRFIAERRHIGFQGILHGGITATILDEVMVWAASWGGKRFCYCGEMSVRYRLPVRVGAELWAESQIVSMRRRLIETTGRIIDETGQLYAEASGKYVPVADAQHDEMVRAFAPEALTADTRSAME